MNTIFLVMLAAVIAGPKKALDGPSGLQIPAAAQAAWNSYDLPGSDTSAAGISLTLQDAPIGRGRVDVFRRKDSRWRLSESYACCTGNTVRVPQSSEPRAVLVRFERKHLYYWTELRAGTSQSLALRPLKNVRVNDRAKSIAVYAQGEDRPRVFQVRDEHVCLVPTRNALICGEIDGESICKLLAAEDTDASAPPDGLPTLVFHVHNVGGRFVVRKPGRFAGYSKAVSSSLIQALPWVGVQLPESNAGWPDAIVDYSADGLAVTRFDPAEVPPSPGFAELSTLPAVRVVVHAHVGKLDQMEHDPSAEMLAFPESESGISAEVPLAAASSDKRGSFVFPQLAPGETYRFKLLASDARPEFHRAAVVAGEALDFVFGVGPTVSGRIALTTGGTSAERVSLEVVPALSPTEALRDRTLLDKVRLASADEDGRFSIVLPTPGNYHLRARWGDATAERAFAVPDGDSNIDLGEITLRTGSALLGFVSNCLGGQIAVIPVPNPSSTFTTGVGEIRQAQVQNDGRFSVDGLLPGQWSVMAKCTNGWIDVIPPMIVVPDSGDVVMRFSAPEPTVK